jgi:hypothetical protein
MHDYKTIMRNILADRERILRDAAERLAGDLESRAREIRKQLASGAEQPLARLAHAVKVSDATLAGRFEEAHFLTHNSNSIEERVEPVRECGNRGPKGGCDLPAGHKGRHEGPNGERW